MERFRGERKRRVFHDPWTATGKPLEAEEIDHFINDDGGLDSQHTGRAMACDCGCLRPPGGFCAECGDAVVCVDCFGHCVCGKPLCPRHSHFVERPGSGGRVRLYRSCHESESRQRLVHRAARALLSPFIRFEDGDGNS